MTDVRDDGVPTDAERAKWTPDDYRHLITDAGWRRLRNRWQAQMNVMADVFDDAIAGDLKNIRRRQLGLKEIPRDPPLSIGRMKQICAMARSNGFVLSQIPYDEYCMILTYEPYVAMLNLAINEGALAEMGL